MAIVNAKISKSSFKSLKANTKLVNKGGTKPVEKEKAAPSKSAGLTGKRIRNHNDARYLAVEQKIHQAIDRMFANGDIKTLVTEFSRYAGIYPTTFYHHYTSLPEAIHHRDQTIYNGLKSCTSSNNISVVYHKLFYYIGENKVYFKNAQSRLNINMARSFAQNDLKPIVLAHWGQTGKTAANGDNPIEKIYYNYSYEMFQEFNEWVFAEDFSKDKVDRHVKHLLYLTNTACHRLNRDGGF